MQCFTRRVNSHFDVSRGDMSRLPSLQKNKKKHFFVLIAAYSCLEEDYKTENYYETEKTFKKSSTHSTKTSLGYQNSSRHLEKMLRRRVFTWFNYKSLYFHGSH